MPVARLRPDCSGTAGTAHWCGHAKSSHSHGTPPEVYVTDGGQRELAWVIHNRAAERPERPRRRHLPWHEPRLALPRHPARCHLRLAAPAPPGGGARLRTARETVAPRP